jgi:hypothetical protein
MVQFWPKYHCYITEFPGFSPVCMYVKVQSIIDSLFSFHFVNLCQNWQKLV